MYVGRDYDVQDVGENEPFTLDFVNEALAVGETLASAVWTCSVISGVDPAAATRIVGSALVSGTMTSQRVTGLLAGVYYELKATATTTAGNIKILWSHVLGQNPA